MILLEGFIVRPIISLTKNPCRKIINGLVLSRKIGPKSVYQHFISFGIIIVS